MDALQKGVLTLVRSGLSGQAMALPDGFDLEQAYPELMRHQVMALGYLGAVHCGLDKKQPIMQELFRNYAQCLQRSESQMAALERVYQAFDKAGVDYMPVKGCNVKALYPSPELRTMGDADILIRVEQYDTIKPIMLELGFSESVESDHELNWTCGPLLVELHKRLIPSYNKDYHRYYGDGWRLATICEGTHYYMSNEDEFIYLFTHFAKHYRGGGIGIRHLIDLQLYLDSHPELDVEYVRRELGQLQLCVFFENIKKVLGVCFEDMAEDAVTEFMIGHIFASGAYGTNAMRKIADVVRDAQQKKSVSSARKSRLIRAVFLPYDAMKDKYPVLKRVPVLLPVYWVVRGFGIVFSGKGKVRKFAKEFNDASVEQAQLYQQALDYVGLDFDFKE